MHGWFIGSLQSNLHSAGTKLPKKKKEQKKPGKAVLLTEYVYVHILHPPERPLVHKVNKGDSFEPAVDVGISVVSYSEDGFHGAM